MSNPDNTTDKDFVMSDSDTNEDVSDRYENKTAKPLMHYTAKRHRCLR